ncbi:MAG: hypothetical protein GKS05_11970 [Nitrospirales bacterium]|nr:hypothetical protein [Nitrospirales bacterium]
MWKKNFLFREGDAIPRQETENELFHDTDPALDSTGLHMEKYISVWLQGEGTEETPTAYTTVYARTATLDPNQGTGFLQPLQGRTHEIKKLLAPQQKGYLRQWLTTTHPSAWEEAEDHFQDIFADE